MEKLIATLPSYLIEIPVFLIWLAAIIFAIVSWNRHPNVSRLVIIGISGLFVLSLISTYINMWLPMYLRDTRGMSYAQMGVYLGIIALVRSILSAGFWSLIVVAIFSSRKQTVIQ